MGIYIAIGGIDPYDKLNINPLLSITCNKKKAGRKKPIKHQMKSSVTQRSGTAEKCFHFSLKAAKRPTISFKHECVPKPQLWKRRRCSI